MQKISLQNHPFYPYLVALQKINNNKIISLFQTRAFRSHAFISPYNFLRRHITVLNLWIGHLMNFILTKKTKITCPLDEPTSCGITTQAILELNLFQQKFEISLKDFHDLRLHLQNEEEGLFIFSISSSWFINPEKTGKRLFQGHDFMIIKYQVQGKNHYQLLQSYIHQYTLNEFLKQNLTKFSYQTYEQLEKEFLTPFENFISKINEPWTEEMDNTYKAQTLIYQQLKGYRPETKIHFEMIRTTNKEEISLNTRSVRLHLPISNETMIYFIALELFIFVKMVRARL